MLNMTYEDEKAGKYQSKENDCLLACAVGSPLSDSVKQGSKHWGQSNVIKGGGVSEFAAAPSGRGKKKS